VIEPYKEKTWKSKFSEIAVRRKPIKDRRKEREIQKEKRESREEICITQ